MHYPCQDNEKFSISTGRDGRIKCNIRNQARYAGIAGIYIVIFVFGVLYDK